MKKSLGLFLALGALGLATHAQAALTTYTPDANTLHLYHLDEATGTSSAANLGTIGGNALTVQESNATTGTNNSPVVTTMLGKPAYAGFGTAVSIAKPVPASPATYAVGNQGVGFNTNGDAVYSQQASGTPSQTPDRVTNFSTYFPTGAYTLEAMVSLPALTTPWTGGQRNIISFESAVTASRSMYFRIDNGTLQLGNAGSFRSIAIPTTGDHGFEADTWFHAAVVHDPSNGGTTTFYWTKVDPSFTMANALVPLAPMTGAQIPQNPTGTPNLMFGADARQALNEVLGGSMDEIRISNVARSADQFIFTIPEPSSLALLALSGVMMLRRRSV